MQGPFCIQAGQQLPYTTALILKQIVSRKTTGVHVAQVIAGVHVARVITEDMQHSSCGRFKEGHGKNDTRYGWPPTASGPQGDIYRLQNRPAADGRGGRSAVHELSSSSVVWEGCIELNHVGWIIGLLHVGRMHRAQSCGKDAWSLLNVGWMHRAQGCYASAFREMYEDTCFSNWVGTLQRSPKWTQERALASGLLSSSDNPSLC